MALGKLDGVSVAFVDANVVTVLLSDASKYDKEEIEKVLKRKKITVLDETKLDELPY